VLGIVYPVVVVLVDVEVEVEVEVEVVVVEVEVEVEVEVVVEVEVDEKLAPSQLSPDHLNHAFMPESQYSSPITGSDGALELTLIRPLMFVICVFAIVSIQLC